MKAMTLLIECFWFLVLNMLTGTVAFFIWKVVSRLKKWRRQIKFLHHLLWIVALAWMFPILFLIWMIQENVYTVHWSNMFEWNQTIRKILAGIGAVWLIGCLLQFITFCFRVRFLSKQRKESTLCQGKSLELFQIVYEQLHIKKKVKLYYNPRVVSPMTVGIFRQDVFLPLEEFTEEELRMIFVHELTHIKHRDYIIRCFMILIVCLNWYHPWARELFWEVDAWNEYYCDQDSIIQCGISDREYFRIIRQCIQSIRKRNVYFTSELYKNKKSMRRRIKMMKKFNERKQVSVLGKVIVTTMFSIGVAITSYSISYAAVWAYDQFAENTTVKINEGAGNIKLMESTKLLSQHLLKQEMLQTSVWDPIKTSVWKQWTLPPKYQIHYGLFNVKKGGKIIINTCSNAVVDFGIIDMDGNWRYIQGSSLTYTFSISESGSYRVFVKNQSQAIASGFCVIYCQNPDL